MLPERKDLVYSSTKTYTHSVGLSACFRQHKAKSHCKFLHGYALEVKLTFTSPTLDENNWVVDFGSLKAIKIWLEDTFDHKLLVADDDPLKYMFLSMDHDEGVCEVRIVPACGCEAFARMIYEHVEEWLGVNYGSRPVQLKSVEVKEHQGNSAICRKRTTYEPLPNN